MGALSIYIKRKIAVSFQAKILPNNNEYHKDFILGKVSYWLEI